MYPVIQSFLAGFPVLILHTSVTVAMLVAAIFVYIKITPYDELKLIRGGNTAAAVSLSGAIIGLALPLAFSMASSISVWEVLIWGPVTLALQLNRLSGHGHRTEGPPKANRRCRNGARDPPGLNQARSCGDQRCGRDRLTIEGFYRHVQAGLGCPASHRRRRHRRQDSRWRRVSS